MERIPALLDREAEPRPTLPCGYGTVYLVGGAQVEGEITLTPAWVVVHRRDDSRDTGCYPVGRVLSVDFKP